MPINYQNIPAAWQLRQHTVEGAIERIVRMLTAAQLSARAVRIDAAQRTIYQQYFSDVPLLQLANVQQIIGLMVSRMTTGTLDFHYVPTLAALNSLGIGRLPAGVSFNNVEAFVVQRGVAANVALRVFFCPRFFTGNVYVTGNVNARTGTGTFLHELSHGVGNTSDYAYTWQPTFAALTAARHAMNADTYRAFCQGFDVLGRITAAPLAGAGVACPVCRAAFTNAVKLKVHRIEAKH
jgi:hypothetical protein